VSKKAKQHQKEFNLSLQLWILDTRPNFPGTRVVKKVINYMVTLVIIIWYWKHWLGYVRLGYQTFLVRGPLIKIWWSAKDKILFYTGIREPLQLIFRTTSGPWSKLGEPLDYYFRTFFRFMALLLRYEEVAP